MRGNSFISKIIRYFLIGLAVPVALLCFFLLVDERILLSPTFETTFKDINEVAFKSVAGNFKKNVIRLDSFSSSLKSKSDFHKNAALEMESNPSVVDIFFVDSDGNVTASDPDKKTSIFRNISRMESKGYETRRMVHDVHYEELLGESVIMMTQPVVLKDGTKGVIGFDIEAGSILDVYTYDDPDLKIKSYATCNNVGINNSALLDHEFGAYLSYFSDKTQKKVVIKNTAYYVTPFGYGNYYGIIQTGNAGGFSSMLFGKLDFTAVLSLSVLSSIGIFAYVVYRLVRPLRIFLKSVGQMAATDEEPSFDHKGIFKEFQEMFGYFVIAKANFTKRSREIEENNDLAQDNIKSLNLRQAIIDERTEKAESQRLEYINRKKGFENIVDSISDLVWTFDELGVITFASPAMESLLGYEEGQLSGVNITRILSGARDGDESSVQVLLKRDYDVIELKFIQRDKKDVIVTSTRTTRIDDNGRTSFILAISRDVTKEKKKYMENHYKSREMVAMNEINQIMTASAGDINGILKSITDKISSLMSVSFAVIDVLREGSLELEAYSTNNSVVVFEKIDDIENTNIGVAIKEARMVIIDSESDKIYDDIIANNTLKHMSHIVYTPLESEGGVVGVLTVGSTQKLDEEKLEMLKYLARSASITIQRSMIYERLRSNYVKTIEAMTNALEEKLYNLNGHTRRVSEFATLIAQKMYLRDEDVEDIRIAALLHDIGKIGINDEFLRTDYKSRKSDELCYKMARSHPEVARKMLEPIGLSQGIMDGVFYHHLRYDMTGYPHVTTQGIKAQPLSAQIIQLADNFDNMLASPHSGSKMELEEAKAIINSKSGSKFAPKIVSVLCEIIDTSRNLILEIAEDVIDDK